MSDRPLNLLSWIPFLWSQVLFPATSTAPTKIRPLSLALLLLLPAVLLYPTLDFKLLEPDEGRYAQIPREMLESGEWVVPQLQGQPYLDKPPLLYWLIMMSYSAFGVSEASARLVPALAVHATILLVYLMGRRSLGERSAFWGALLLSVAPGFMGMGRLLILDGLLTFWVTLALFASFEAIRGDRLKLDWWYLAAVAAGMGVLTKGPIPLLLMLPPLWVYRRLTGNTTTISTKAMAGFFGVVTLLNIPWYIGIFMREPVFLRYFFWEHNILRFVKPFDHLQPFWFYVPIMLGGLMPSTFLLYSFAKQIFSGEKEVAAQRTKQMGFWLIAGLWCVGFFSMSGCKLPTYVLPAFPCLMLVLGDFVARSNWDRSLLTRCSVGIVAALQAFVFYVALPWYAELRSPMGVPDVAERLQVESETPMFCFPRNVDSVAFYTGRADLKSCRTKVSQELVEALIKEERSIVLFTHRHSLDTFKQVLPPQLRVRESQKVRHGGTGASFLDKLVGDGPWGLCDVAIIEKVDPKAP